MEKGSGVRIGKARLWRAWRVCKEVCGIEKGFRESKTCLGFKKGSGHSKMHLKLETRTWGFERKAG